MHVNAERDYQDDEVHLGAESFIRHAAQISGRISMAKRNSKPEQTSRKQVDNESSRPRTVEGLVKEAR